ncbi:MAG: serine/threonine protein kinase [Labilithrix sp.]|nr:serine/threonine protein kinase [Labilithrix sp.]MCW5815311.1 serine/threonine protein kinase [Labilithrix sp.]
MEDDGRTVAGIGVAPEPAAERTVRGGTPAGMEPREPRPSIAGIRRIGRGGMGVVWEAHEHRFERPVAIKVHADGGPERSKDELFAEAFVAAKIGDPGIVRVLDVGYTLDEQPYYAMELVAGTDLAVLLADGALSPRRAIDVAADIARAAAAAHEHGVIHRDLKPRNVIIDVSGRARVLDFGIALNVRAGDRFEGVVTGSPSYMAPEQALGQKMGPQTDIFAIGLVLYEMLTGTRAFTGATIPELLAAICTAEPEPPSARNPAVHEDLDTVVLRCLAKDPAERFTSARVLFETLRALAEGKSIDVTPLSMRRPSYTPKVLTPPPPDRPRREDAKKHLAWTWKLASSPQALWPYVANTERVNRAVGLTPVNFTDEPSPEGGAIRTGEMRVMGLALRWREYPFEWVKDREHSVFRWYSSGPVAALWNRVALEPLDGGGCELRHDVWMSPRGVIGQLAAFVETTKLGSAFDRFYRHLDEVLVAGNGADPFEEPHAPTPEVRAAVDRGSVKLRGEGFERTLVEKLALHLLFAPEASLRRMRPYELADTWGTDRGETLDLMIHAAHEHLLEPAWDVVCPKCMLAHETLRELAHVTRMGTCKACVRAFERDLRESVELVFEPHAALRAVDRATFCAGAPALRPHVLVQQVIDPGSERQVAVELPRGTYRVAGAVAGVPAELVASPVGFATNVVVLIQGDRIEARPAIVRAGEVTVEIRNLSEHEETLRVEVPGARADGVAASIAITHPSFRELYDEQLLARGELVPVSELAFVFVAMKDASALYEELGDAAACAELSRLDELVRATSREHEGTVVPSSLDTLVVAFPSAARAFKAALAVRREIAAAKLGGAIGVACHGGRCIALTRAGKAEFFGETLHRGQALIADCPPGGLALSASMTADRAVAVAVHESGLAMSVGKSGAGPYAGRRVTLLTSA